MNLVSKTLASNDGSLFALRPVVTLVLLMTSHHLWTAEIVDGRCVTEDVVSPYITATFYALIPFLLLTIFNSLIIYTTIKVILDNLSIFR